jgi:ADP-ribose pyrophosphatase
MSGEPKIVAEGKFLDFKKRGAWEYVEWRNVSGCMGVLAVTDANKILFVEQFRIPVNASVIELPAGLAGDIAGQESEDLAVAAERELWEETGYHAARFEKLCAGPVSPGLCTEFITLYRATGLRKTGSGGGDAHESITVHEVPAGEIVGWLAAREREGKMVDLKVWAGLYFLGR